MKYYDIMVDTETTGLDPSHAAIIQIAAVRFNWKEQTLDATDMFDRCLQPLPGRYFDEGTRNWWMGRNKAVYDQIMARREMAAPVLSDFYDWVLKDYDGAEPIRMWARPICFDWPMLDSHMKQIGKEMPTHFRYSMDMNSVLRGLGHDPMIELYYTESVSNHNALLDVLNQLENLFVGTNKLTQAPHG